MGLEVFSLSPYNHVISVGESERLCALLGDSGIPELHPFMMGTSALFGSSFIGHCVSTMYHHFSGKLYYSSTNVDVSEQHYGQRDRRKEVALFATLFDWKNKREGAFACYPAPYSTLCVGMSSWRRDEEIQWFGVDSSFAIKGYRSRDLHYSDKAFWSGSYSTLYSPFIYQKRGDISLFPTDKSWAPTRMFHSSRKISLMV